MAKIKGFYKGFKFISQIFVVKEQEMEIGCPTDVKHVAHIGWDGPSGNGPTWMKDFSHVPEFQSSPREAADIPGPNLTGDGSLHYQGPSDERLVSNAETESGTENSMGRKSISVKLKDDPASEAPTVSKKQKREKIKLSSSTSKSTSRSYRRGKTKPKQPDMQSIAVAAAS